MNRDEMAVLAKLVAQELRSEIQGDRWLDVEGAASYLSMSQDSLRGIIKRKQIDFVKTPTGRIRLRRTALDDWMVSRMFEHREHQAMLEEE